jgi:hypothetical protein
MRSTSLDKKRLRLATGMHEKSGISVYVQDSGPDVASRYPPDIPRLKFQCPLLGVKRTLVLRSAMSAFDPFETSHAAQAPVAQVFRPLFQASPIV